MVTNTDGTINKMCFYKPTDLGGHGKTLEVMEGILPGMKRSAIEAKIGKPTEKPQESGGFITVWYSNLIPRIDVEIGYSVYALDRVSSSKRRALVHMSSVSSRVHNEQNDQRVSRLLPGEEVVHRPPAISNRIGGPERFCDIVLGSSRRFYCALPVDQLAQ